MMSGILGTCSPNHVCSIALANLNRYCSMPMLLLTLMLFFLSGINIRDTHRGRPETAERYSELQSWVEAFVSCSIH